MKVRTRVAPSPTGYPHIGTIYQAMFDFVFAKKYDGKFIVRIEDTDRARFVEGAEEIIFDSLKWFSLPEDESPYKGGEFGPYRSSERLDIYKKYVDQLLRDGNAYRCFCSKERLDEMRKKQEQEKKAPMYDKTCRFLTENEIEDNLKANKPYVVRMKIPENRQIVVEDAIFKTVNFDSNQIDDQVILKSDGYPTYHLAAVVDDYLMQITHVFRGQEWLPSTPKHILLYEFLGFEKSIPQFIHLPVILNTQGGGKLSKRDGHSSVDYYKQQGFLPEAILNYLANIVWNHPGGKEIFDFREIVNAFRVNPTTLKIDHVEIYSQGPKFDLRKLEWMNGEYIRAMSDEELATKLSDFYKGIIDDMDKIKRLSPLVKDRIKTLRDFEAMTDFIFEKPEYELETFNKLKIPDIKEALAKVVEKLASLETPWVKENFEGSFQALAADLGLNNTQMFQLIRVAISGGTVTPPLFESIEILGEDETKSRVKIATDLF